MEEADARFLWSQKVAKYPVEGLCRAVTAASKKIDKAGAVFRVCMDARMTFCKEVYQGESIGRKQIEYRVQNGGF